jgi:hypothetical protein
LKTRGRLGGLPRDHWRSRTAHLIQDKASHGDSPMVHYAFFTAFFTAFFAGALVAAFFGAAFFTAFFGAAFFTAFFVAIVCDSPVLFTL